MTSSPNRSHAHRGRRRGRRVRLGRRPGPRPARRRSRGLRATSAPSTCWSTGPASSVPSAPCGRSTPDEWWATMEVNLRGWMRCTQLVLPEMVARRRGRILNISSQAGVRRWPLVSAYSVSKAAVTKLTENLAHEVDRFGISVLSVHPGSCRRHGDRTRATVAPSPPSSPRGPHLVVGGRELANGRGADPADAVDLIVRLAAGEADALTGRHISRARRPRRPPVPSAGDHRPRPLRPPTRTTSHDLEEVLVKSTTQRSVHGPAVLPGPARRGLAHRVFQGLLQGGEVGLPPGGIYRPDLDGQWPLVGRHEELDLFTATLADPRAARPRDPRARRAWARPGWPTSASPWPTGPAATWPGPPRRRVRARCPLGALAHLLPAGVADERRSRDRDGRGPRRAARAGATARWCCSSTTSSCSTSRRRPWWASWSTPTSSSSWGPCGRARRVPPGLESLWHRARVRRVDLEDLDRAAVDTLLHLVLGGPVEATTSTPSGRPAKATSCSCGSWCSAPSRAATSSTSGACGGWSARSSPPRACEELVAARLGALGSAATDALDILAVWEPAGSVDPGGHRRARAAGAARPLRSAVR